MKHPSFAQTLRLIWLDAKAATPEGLRRRDLVDLFGMSRSAASKDIAAYQRLFPGRLSYLLGDKCYLSLEPFFAPGTHHVAMAAIALTDGVLRDIITREAQK